MYVFIGFAIVVLVIALAWHGVGLTHREPEERASDSLARHPSRPRAVHDARPRKVVAPDDDPAFLSEIDRQLRDQGKSGT